MEEAIKNYREAGIKTFEFTKPTKNFNEDETMGKILKLLHY